MTNVTLFNNKGELSAYSVFNEGFRELLGTLNAEQFDAEIRHVNRNRRANTDNGNGANSNNMDTNTIVNNNDNNDNNDNKARKSGKKARRNYEERLQRKVEREQLQNIIDEEAF